MYQTRSESNGLHYFETFEQAKVHAEGDPTVWKISGQGQRLIKRDGQWVDQPILKMAKPKLSLKGTAAYTVFSDDDTFEPMGGTQVVLVDGDHDLEDDGDMKALLATYDVEAPITGDPMHTTKFGKARVRVISVKTLLEHYIKTRKDQP